MLIQLEKLRCLIRSGNPEHPADIIQNATLQIKSSHQQVLVFDSKYVSSIHSDNFVNLGPFIDGFANVLIPSELNPVQEIQIKFAENCTNWIIISEVNCVWHNLNKLCLKLTHIITYRSL